EVFRYDAETGHIFCASCNPSGARPRGVWDSKQGGQGLLVDLPSVWVNDPEGLHDHWLAGSLPAWNRLSIREALYQPHYLSEEGRILFNSADALTPSATGHTRPEAIGKTTANVGAERVYQWEPNGVGSCALAAGCISLVSGPET